MSRPVVVNLWTIPPGPGLLIGMTTSVLYLDEKHRIARSATRDCYLHPEDPGRVVKVVRASARQREKGGWFRRNANQKEWRSYRYMQRRFGDLHVFVACHGFVETNLGSGLVFDCVRDADGKVSLRLQDALVSPAHDSRRVAAAVADFCRTVLDREIPLFDLNFWNILIQVQADGAYRPVSIDIKGRFNNYELIPVSSFIPYFARRKVRRRCRRLIETVRRFIENNRAP